MHSSFAAAHAVVQAVAGDPLDLPTSTFATEAGVFNDAIKDLERRLAAILCQASGSRLLTQPTSGATARTNMQCGCRRLTTAQPRLQFSSCWRVSRACWTAALSRLTWSARRSVCFARSPPTCARLLSPLHRDANLALASHW